MYIQIYKWFYIMWYYFFFYLLTFFMKIGPSVLRAPAEQTKVATVLGKYFFSSYHRYS